MLLFFLGLWEASGGESDSSLSRKASPLPSRPLLAEVGLEEAILSKGNTDARMLHYEEFGATADTFHLETTPAPQEEAAEQ